MSNTEYKPETYWSKVAERIDGRENNNVIAGDDEPFYRYKRIEFLKLLTETDLKDKSVLEVGNGPGGNLTFIMSRENKPSRIAGADISLNMVNLAKKNTKKPIELYHFDGANLPFDANTFDVIFTATVLQHNTDEKMLFNIVKDICRVSKNSVFIFERIEKSPKGDDLCKGRTIGQYSDLFEQHGFKLASKKFINIQISYLICGAIRKLLNPKSRIEGEPLTKFSIFLENISLPLTKIMDKIFKSDRDLCRLHFVKN